MANNHDNHETKSRIKRTKFRLLNNSSDLAALHPLVFDFLVQYIALEVSIRQIWKLQNEEKEFKVSVKSVEKCFKYYGVHCDHDLIGRVFGSETHRDSKSLKKLRDEFVHSMSIKGIKEIENRYQKLRLDMINIKSAIQSAI